MIVERLIVRILKKFNYFSGKIKEFVNFLLQF